MNCQICKNEGWFEKDEWVGTDTCFPLLVKCACNYDD